MRITTSKYIIILLTSFQIIACSKDEFCAEPTESLAYLRFYSKVGRLLTDTSVIGFTVTGIIDYDSLLYDSVNTSTFKLPLSAARTSSSFIMSFSIPDTLIVTDTIDTDTLLTATALKKLNHSGQLNNASQTDTVVIDTTIFYYYKYDTISIYYLPVLYFISQSCGFTYHYQVDSVQSTKNVIDTIITNSGLITTKDNENFKVLL